MYCQINWDWYLINIIICMSETKVNFNSCNKYFYMRKRNATASTIVVVNQEKIDGSVYFSVTNVHRFSHSVVQNTCEWVYSNVNVNGRSQCALFSLSLYSSNRWLERVSCEDLPQFFTDSKLINVFEVILVKDPSLFLLLFYSNRFLSFLTIFF